MLQHDPSSSASVFHAFGHLDRAWLLLQHASAAGHSSGPARPATLAELGLIQAVGIESGQVGLQCTVCLEEFALGDLADRLPCQHHFHSQCIRLWLEKCGSCPVCRKPLSSGVESETSEAGSAAHAESLEQHRVNRRLLFSMRQELESSRQMTQSIEHRRLRQQSRTQEGTASVGTQTHAPPERLETQDTGSSLRRHLIYPQRTAQANRLSPDPRHQPRTRSSVASSSAAGFRNISYPYQRNPTQPSAVDSWLDPPPSYYASAAAGSLSGAQPAAQQQQEAASQFTTLPRAQQRPIRPPPVPPRRTRNPEVIAIPAYPSQDPFTSLWSETAAAATAADSAAADAGIQPADQAMEEQYTVLFAAPHSSLHGGELPSLLPDAPASSVAAVDPPAASSAEETHGRLDDSAAPASSSLSSSADEAKQPPPDAEAAGAEQTMEDSASSADTAVIMTDQALGEAASTAASSAGSNAAVIVVDEQPATTEEEEACSALLTCQAAADSAEGAQSKTIESVSTAVYEV